jgi:excisionase family DNA binding protein
MSTNIPFRLIRKSELCRILGVSRATLERLVAEKHLPPPHQISSRAVRWRSDEVEAFINNLQRIDDAYSCRVDRKGGAV